MKTDEEHAAAIALAVRRLEHLVKAAAQDGLRIVAGRECSVGDGKAFWPVFPVEVMRPILAKKRKRVQCTDCRFVSNDIPGEYCERRDEHGTCTGTLFELEPLQ
jgi:hypothetical protein